MTSNPLTAGLRLVHPGELLREDVLPALGVSKTRIAALLGISRQHLYDILDEKKPVTVPVALRFGKLFGNGPDIWLRLQQAYALRIAEIEMADQLAAMPTLKPLDKAA
jgi:addiction module HigA family antidote